MVVPLRSLHNFIMSTTDIKLLSHCWRRDKQFKLSDISRLLTESGFRAVKLEMCRVVYEFSDACLH